jgi:hypothetical protein
MKYGLNKINTRLFTQQVGWFGCKGIEHNPWGPRFKLHNHIHYGQHWNIDQMFHTYLNYLGWVVT